MFFYRGFNHKRFFPDDAFHNEMDERTDIQCINNKYKN
jgi:hypothetical protein